MKKAKSKKLFLALALLATRVACGNAIVVTNAQDVGEGTLRAAFEKAKDGDRIWLDFPIGTAVRLASPIDVKAGRFPTGLVVDGNGCTLDGEMTCRILEVSRGNRIVCHDLSFVRGNSNQGGAISNLGNLELRNCTLSNNNSRGQGGAIWSAGGSAFVAVNCSFAGNKSKDQGGAIYTNQSTLLLECCSLIGNVSDVQGGALYGYAGRITAIATTFSHNTARHQGGAAFVHNGVFVNCSVYENVASSAGGVFTFGASAVNTVVVGNVADSQPNVSGNFNAWNSVVDLRGEMILGDVLGREEVQEVEGVRQTFRTLVGGRFGQGGAAVIWHDQNWESVAYSQAVDGDKTYLNGSGGADTLWRRDQLGRRYNTFAVGAVSVPMFHTHPFIAEHGSRVASREFRAIGNWYSQVRDPSGETRLMLNDQARPRFATRSAGKPMFEVLEQEYVAVPVENVKPFLYYGLGYTDSLGDEFKVEPGLWLQADADGRLSGDVRAPKGKGQSRFFRVVVTDNPVR